MFYFSIFLISFLQATYSTRFTSAASLSFDPIQQYSLPFGGDEPLQASFSLVEQQVPPSLTVKSVPTSAYRPKSVDALLHARSQSLRHAQDEKVDWDLVEVNGPDVQDRHTLVQLARMSGDAYALPGQKNWYDIDPAWNEVRDLHLFGLHPSKQSTEILNSYARASRLAGKTLLKDSADTSSSPQTTLPSSCPSKEPLSKVPRRRRTSTTTTSSSPAVAPA